MGSVPAWDIVECPQDGCIMPAEQTPLYVTAYGAVHIRVHCIDGHITFTERPASG